MIQFPFRPSTLEERKEFYEKEFSVKKTMHWFGSKKPQLIAIDAGTDTNALKNKSWKDSLFYCYFEELEEKIKKYIPEDIYYDRNIYKKPKLRFKRLEHYDFLSDKNITGQELIFDIDADNITCTHPKNQSVCNACLKKAWLQTQKLQRELKSLHNLKKTRIIYSGKGFHLHVQDKHTYSLTKQERIKLATKLRHYPIDPWVSEGNIELVRLPFSLNATVSRITLPIQKTFSVKLIIPKFLKP